MLAIQHPGASKITLLACIIRYLPASSALSPWEKERRANVFRRAEASSRCLSNRAIDGNGRHINGHITGKLRPTKPGTKVEAGSKHKHKFVPRAHAGKVGEPTVAQIPWYGMSMALWYELPRGERPC